MEAKTLIKYRDQLKNGKDYPLLLFGNNNVLFNERFDCVIWNDEDSVIQVTRSNDNAVFNQALPIVTTVMEYGEIQTITVQTDAKAFLEIAASYGHHMTEKQKAIIIDSYSVGDGVSKAVKSNKIL